MSCGHPVTHVQRPPLGTTSGDIHDHRPGTPDRPAEGQGLKEEPPRGGGCGYCRDTAAASRLRKASGIRPADPAQSPSVPCSPSPTPVASPTCQHLLLLLGVLPATGQDRLQAKGQGARQDIPQAGPGWPMERWAEWAASCPSSRQTPRDHLHPGAPAEPGLGRLSCRGCAPRGQARPSVRGLIAGRKLSRSSRADFPFLFCIGLCTLCSQAWL